MVAGFNISCVGDYNAYSYLPSRLGNTLSDQMATHVLDNLVAEYIKYTFLDRGSDERQYCAPGVDLPVASIMRPKFGAYGEYHTSDDNLDFISPAGLNGGYEALRHCLIGLEANKTYKATVLGEPQLGKYGLYPSARKAGDPKPKDMLNILAYSDGQTSLLDIAQRINQPIWNLAEPAERLHQAGLLEDVTNER